MGASSFHLKFAKPVLWGWLLALSFGVQLWLCVPAFAEMISQTPQGVSIKVDDRPLPELIKEIRSKTGIQIKAPDSMKEEKVTVRIEAQNWEEAVELLLRDFNHIKLSGPENENDTFLLLGGQRKGGPLAFQTPSKALSGTKRGKRTDPARLKKNIQTYKEKIKKRRKERRRKLVETKENQKQQGQ